MARELLATDAQWSYIRRLMNEAFAHLYRGKDLPNIDVHHQPTYYTRSQASADIKTLLAIKARGWRESNPMARRVMKQYNLFWSPTGQKIGSVVASTKRAAIRKAPAPYSKYKGEIYAEEPSGRERANPGIQRGKWIPAHAVKFNKDGGVSVMY